MSFITKRERVFHELDLYDLPARNEGKLKTFASCTDARAWSHFGTSKTEHLTELIKRNNDLSCGPKYVPTKVIVDTLLVSKNIEISRLKQKIDEFEQMLAVYEELDLDCAQKCEIAKAHAAIKEANKDLYDLCLNLDMSTYTDNLETESFQTGISKSMQYSLNASLMSKPEESDKSHGDAWTVMSLEKDIQNQANQTAAVCPCDVGVSVCDPRLDEMRDEIITKDAKLNAMHNSMTILENDICEPFGIYAHIYTALEKIYGILSQNATYKQYLNLMTAGKDIRCIDIKGKILFKIKVLEKFCLALVAPCSKEFKCSNTKDCTCYRVDVSENQQCAYRLSSAPLESTKRSQLVADIMEYEEMKELLSKESTPDKMEDFGNENDLDIAYSINEENQRRIKDLQACYEDMLNCYENLKHENDCIRIKCEKYEELELELERLRGQLKEYNALWNEKEHYRKRSEDLDSLKEQYMVLAEESSGLETKLKAESEINNMKRNTIDELRAQNLDLEKRLNDLHVTFEKNKNNLQCQLQEAECKCMCQEQQIKSLSSQIVKLLEQEPAKMPCEDTAHVLLITEENQALKHQLKNYEEIEREFHNKLLLVNELEAQIAQWRAAYEEIDRRNKYLENCIETEHDEKERLLNENRKLHDTIRDNSIAVENLMDVIKTKSVEIKNLSDEKQSISDQLGILEDRYENHLNLSRKESQELLGKVKDYDEFVQKQEDLTKVIQDKMRDYESLKKLLQQKLEENQNLKNDLNALQIADIENKKSIDLAKKESLIMENKISELEDISQQFINLREAFEKLSTDKNNLENELRKKTSQLENAIYSVKINRKESEELLRQSATVKEELAKLNFDNQQYAFEKNELQTELALLREENVALKNKSAMLFAFEQKILDLKRDINELLKEKADLKDAFEIRSQEISNLYTSLENKIEENQSLNAELKALKTEAINNMKSFENEKELNQMELDTHRRESSAAIEKLQIDQNKLGNEYEELKTNHEIMKLEKEKLERDLEAQLLNLKILQQEKKDLAEKTDEILAHNNDIEKALMTTRNELLLAQSQPPEKTPYVALMHDIQLMKAEKVEGQNKIRELLDRLDESEQIIANFNDEVQNKDHRIAVMQNSINGLEDELRRLQDLLENAIGASNDIKNTNQSIELARKQIEAHHSRASHNMKLELAILKNSKSELENKLSIAKSQHELTFKDKQKYLSEIDHLKNDRDDIIININQLEIYSAGDSELTPDDCELEDIRNSLQRIRKAFETKHTKCASLEQTLAKVQASSQLVINKADDAKNYFDNEKQKILIEKADALKDKLRLEKELSDIKKELDKQISRDGGIINDLEAEICNQKLIIEKINDSTQTYIAKLEDEMKALQDLYQNSLSKMREMQLKLDSNTDEKHKNEDIIKGLISDLEKKSKEVADLQSLAANKSKKTTNKKIQTQEPSSKHRSISTQTDEDQLISFDHRSKPNKSTDPVPEIELLNPNRSPPRDYVQPAYEFLHQHRSLPVNEVHILAAEVQETFDFVRSSYLNYKIKRLSRGLLQHHSISSSSNTGESSEANNTSCSTDGDPYKLEVHKTQSSNEVLVDIYHSPSADVHNSSKIIDINTLEPKIVQNAKKTDNSDPDIKHKVEKTQESKPTANVVKEPIPNTNQSNRQTAPSDSVFIIFKDNYENKQYEQVCTPLGEQREITNDKKVKHILNEPVNNSLSREQKYKNPVQIKTEPSQLHTKQKQLDKNKEKLDINLPRVGTTTDYDDNSLDSFILDVHSHPVKEIISDTTVRIPPPGEDITKFDTPSLPTISDADDIYLESRSFLEVHSKHSSFFKSSESSDNKTSYDKSDDKRKNIIDNMVGALKGTTQAQEIFSLVGHLDDLANNLDSTRIARSDQSNKIAMKIHEPDHTQNNLNKYDNSRDTNIYYKAKAKILPNKTPQQNIKVHDKSDHKNRSLSAKERNIRPNITSHEDLKQDSDDKDDFVNDERNMQWTGKSNIRVNDYPNYKDHPLSDGKNKTRPNITSQQNLKQDNVNHSDDSKIYVVNDESKKYDPPQKNIGVEALEARGKLIDQKVILGTERMSKTKTLGNISKDGMNNFSSVDYFVTDKMSSENNFDQGRYDYSDISVGHFIDDRPGTLSHHDLGRIAADVFTKVFKSPSKHSINSEQDKQSPFGLKYILNSVEQDPGIYSSDNVITIESDFYPNQKNQSSIALTNSKSYTETNNYLKNQSVMAILDTSSKHYEEVIDNLKKSLEDVEKDHKMQMEAIKNRYDRNISSIINEHNKGVKNIQNLHEEALQDIMRAHENEVENLRSLSIEAMSKVEKLETQCNNLKSKLSIASTSVLDEVPSKCIDSLELRKCKIKPTGDTKKLTKTNVEAFNVKPKVRLHGPCTCSFDVNLSDTIRHIFEQVDVEQRKMAEITYLKYIATKISNGQIEALDTQELSFLHLKVCRTWKLKLSHEEALQKKIDSLEVELIKKQRSAQQHMAELDRKVAQEKKRLEEVREAVCRTSPANFALDDFVAARTAAENTRSCACNIAQQELSERRSAGDLMLPAPPAIVYRSKKPKTENRVVMTRHDADERRDKRLYTDEPPTRLRRQQDRQSRLVKK